MKKMISFGCDMTAFRLEFLSALVVMDLMAVHWQCRVKAGTLIL